MDEKLKKDGADEMKRFFGYADDNCDDKDCDCENEACDCGCDDDCECDEHNHDECDDDDCDCEEHNHDECDDDGVEIDDSVLENVSDSAKLKFCLDLLMDETKPYNQRLAAYDYLSENGEETVDDMLARLVNATGDVAQMLVEILANFKGRKEIYYQLVTFLYRGDDVALFAKLLGGYGDESAIEVLNSFAEENELDYNEFMEVRNAVEELGGVFKSKQDFSDDPFYKFIKGIDEE